MKELIIQMELLFLTVIRIKHFIAEGFRISIVEKIFVYLQQQKIWGICNAPEETFMLKVCKSVVLAISERAECVHNANQLRLER